MERRLTTILAADAVGYSRLMAADEAGTLAALKAIRQELIDPKVLAYRGRVVKLMGDGALMEFGSVVDAVRFAADLQQAIAQRSAEIPADRRITYRIGINIGDVMVEGDDIYGDCVNVAARLEGLAEPGGVWLSGTVFEHVKGKVDLSFADRGERQVKNIPKAIRVFSLAFDNGEEVTQDDTAPSASATASENIPATGTLSEAGMEIDLSLPDKPSIAVLPFDNMSTDPEQEFFSDGIAEDIITALSKIGDLLVIARNSSFAYKGKAIDIKQVSREQGVRYVLEGSVRKAGKRVRITAQLIDATTGHHAWAERYDRDLEDIFAVQDEITREVVIALDVRLREGEQARVWSGSTKNLGAWECVRLGREALNKATKEERVKARRLFERALELDGNYAMAWFSLGGVYFHEAEFATYASGLDHEALLESSIACINKALELDPTFADAYSLLGLCLLSKKDHEQAIAMSEKAIALAPNHAENLAMAAAILNKSGQPERAFDLLKRAMRLCPLYPAWFLSVLGRACRLLRRNELAVSVYEEAIRRNPDAVLDRIGLVAALSELGQEEEVRKTVVEILRRHPDFSIKRYMARLSYRDPAELRRFEESLRKAGLPE